MPTKILFLHGLEARPGGFKPTYLASQGFDVLNPALPDESFDDAVSIAQQQLDLNRPKVIVGSSRGAAVAMALDAGMTPRVLIAPAWRWCGVDPQVGSRTIILHSQHDDLVPVADSWELARLNDLPADALVEIGADHRMNDATALDAICKAIRFFAS